MKTQEISNDFTRFLYKVGLVFAALRDPLSPPKVQVGIAQCPILPSLRSQHSLLRLQNKTDRTGRLRFGSLRLLEARFYILIGYGDSLLHGPWLPRSYCLESVLESGCSA